MTRGFVAVLGVALIGCGKKEAAPAAAPPAAPPPGATSAATLCPATGLWAECSVVYHLGRAGMAVHVDSAGTPAEKLLTGKLLVVNVGRADVLEVYLYADSAARIADEKKLDRTQFVDDTATQTIKRERTLIESVNLVGLLTSLNSRQRQRVSDALTAGPPQPATP